MANAEVARSAVATRSALLLARDGESEARKPHPMKAAVGERSAVPRKLFSGGAAQGCVLHQTQSRRRGGRSRGVRIAGRAV